PPIYTLSLHDALPISLRSSRVSSGRRPGTRRTSGPASPFRTEVDGDRADGVWLGESSWAWFTACDSSTGRTANAGPGFPVLPVRSEEHTSELQSRRDL